VNNSQHPALAHLNAQLDDVASALISRDFARATAALDDGPPGDLPTLTSLHREEIRSLLERNRQIEQVLVAERERLTEALAADSGVRRPPKFIDTEC